MTRCYQWLAGRARHAARDWSIFNEFSEAEDGASSSRCVDEKVAASTESKGLRCLEQRGLLVGCPVVDA